MQGLAAHVRHNHPEHWSKYKTAAAPDNPEPATAAVLVVDSSAPVSPLAHLDLAITKLDETLCAVRADIQRLIRLQAEEAEFARQMEALAAARRAFEKEKTMTAGSTSSQG